MPEGQHRYYLPHPSNSTFANYRTRLYVRGKHVSYTRGKRNTSPNISLIKIEGCDSIKDAEFYLGKRIAYVYKVQFHPNHLGLLSFNLLMGTGTASNSGKQNSSYLGESD